MIALSLLFIYLLNYFKISSIKMLNFLMIKMVGVGGHTKFIIIIYILIIISDLHRCNIVEDPMCSCGHLEDAYQLFFVGKNII